jgi:hypothetical protein
MYCNRTSGFECRHSFDPSLSASFFYFVSAVCLVSLVPGWDHMGLNIPPPPPPPPHIAAVMFGCSINGCSASNSLPLASDKKCLSSSFLRVALSPLLMHPASQPETTKPCPEPPVNPIVRDPEASASGAVTAPWPSYPHVPTYAGCSLWPMIRDGCFVPLILNEILHCHLKAAS